MYYWLVIIYFLVCYKNYLVKIIVFLDVCLFINCIGKFSDSC